MSTNPWEDFAQRSRELYEQQAELAQSWVDGQAKLAGTLAEAGRATARPASGPMPRPWPSCGAPGWRSAARSAPPCPGMAEPGQIAGETLGRFLDPMSLALVGGSQVGETIRRLTEGPRFADLGAIERRMGKVMELWLQVQQAARAYEAVVAGAWARGQPALRHRVPGAGPGRQGAEPAEGRAQALARHRQPDAARDPSLRAVPRAPRASCCATAWTSCWPSARWSRALVEPAGLPTRTEIDEVHRSVHELKRRVRALEKAGAAAEPPQRPASPRRPAGPQGARDREPGHDPDAHRRPGRADARGRRLQHQGRRRGRAS